MTPELLLGHALIWAAEIALTWCAICYVAGRGPEVRAGWLAGLGWLSARRTVWAGREQTVRRLTRGAAMALLLWLLVHTLRAHGQHRAEVAL